MDSAAVGRAMLRGDVPYRFDSIANARVEEVNLTRWIVSRPGDRSETVRLVASGLICQCLSFTLRQTCPHVAAVERHRARPE